MRKQWRNVWILAGVLVASPKLHAVDGIILIDQNRALAGNVTPGDLAGFERCLVLFDGRDEEALRLARGRWKAFKGAGHPVSYWRQGVERGWEKQA